MVVGWRLEQYVFDAAQPRITKHGRLALVRTGVFFFSAEGFGFFLGVPGSMLTCFSAFLLFCFYAFLLLCFSSFCFSCFLLFLLLCFSCFSAFHASLLLCFTCFFSFLLLCFPCFSAFLLLCFCALLLLRFYFSFLQSCVFAALLPAPLLLCFLSLLPLFFLFFCFLLSCLYPKWNPKHPRWNPKKP